jgi:hypothetical protein
MRCLLRFAPLVVSLSLLSISAQAQVLKGSVPPAGSTILVPEEGFTGGVLTGVVLGPDEKPVPNAQVNLDSGVPVTLSGEVIGDEQPQEKTPPNPNRAIDIEACFPPVGTIPNTGNPAPHCQPAPPVQKPSDCTSVLQQFTGGVHPPNPNAGAQGPASGSSAGYGSDGSEGRSLVTDASGRFALCVPTDAKKIDVSFADGSVHTAVPTSGQFPPDPCAQAGRFLEPAARMTVCQRITKPTLSQDGQTWLLPAVQAISPGGDRVLTTLRTPRDLKPGPATLSFVNGDGQPQQFTGGVFKMLSARLDRSKLRSHEGADFEYTAQFGDGSVHPCVEVTVAGPVMLVQAPPQIIAVNASGVGKFSGKIRATQVAPGSTIPFDIVPHIHDCSPGPAQDLAGKNPGPNGFGERNPGPGGVPGSDTEMKLSLTPAPTVPNPFVKEPPPQRVALNSNAPLGPEHTMDSTTMNKYEKVTPPVSSCNFQTKTPVIASVEGISQPTVFTQQLGLNYFTIHGCNFGSTPGQVYLVMHPDDGPGFPQPVELYPMQGNNVWTPNTIHVSMNPEFGGHLDQTGDVLRVVTSNKLTAELPNQVFHAERVALAIGWMPRSQVALGSASDPLTPQFQTAAPNQSDQLFLRGSLGSTTATVNRSVSNVGGPFTVQDDAWDFSKLRPGFEVMYATPSYSNWNGSGCNQVSGKWGTAWDSASQLRVHVQGCYHSGTGYFRTSTAQYGLAIQLRGPKGALPWPSSLK